MDFNGKRVFITGGAGFIGSHAAETFAKAGGQVTVYDNLSRAKLLGKAGEWASYNWNYLSKLPGVKLVKGDVLDEKTLEKEITGSDVIVHCAAQTAVTTSVTDPRTDFLNNALGSFNVLDAARRHADGAAFIYCSTNKVYGDNVNGIGLSEGPTRYSFAGEFAQGVPESFPLDASEHTPYGCSKLTGDAYARDFAKLYGLRTGIFRMSCIYGERQFGVEDQGWLAHFIISAAKGRGVTIYGDGKQVRDVLYAKDLIACYQAFLEKSKALAGEAFNIGGGSSNTLSLLELISLIKDLTGKELQTTQADWRPADQKVYVSDIRKAEAKLGWKPATSPREGVSKLAQWVSANEREFA